MLGPKENPKVSQSDISSRSDLDPDGSARSLNVPEPHAAGPPGSISALYKSVCGLIMKRWSPLMGRKVFRPVFMLQKCSFIHAEAKTHQGFYL